MAQNDDNLRDLLPVGTTLQMGKYRIERCLASGGFGNTYVVTNTKFDERMAMKEFFMKGVSERNDHNTVSVSNAANRDSFASQREKFNKEARRLRRLHNEHIVQVHDLFDENDTSYYVMDYVDGESLSQRLKRTGRPLSEAEALKMLDGVLDALDAVHREGIWHLDLKPGNIMVDKSGMVKVIDFGASKQLTAGEGYTTTTTAMCYTPGYAPTEQIDQKMELIGPWTDLYALGATLYHLLTLHQPPSVSELQEDDAFTFPKSVSPRVQRLVKWLMTSNRKRRPQSVSDVRDYLYGSDGPVVADDEDEDTVFGGHRPGKPTHEDVKATPSHRLSPKLLAGVAAAVVALVALVWAFAGGGGHASLGDGIDSAAIVTAVDEVKAASTVSNAYFKSAQGVCAYTGPVDSDGNPDGVGEASFSDGRLYRGPFVHGKMHGDNAHFTYDNGDTFEGSFNNNAFARGRYTVKSDGSYFVGTFKNGQPDVGNWYDRTGNQL